MKFITIGSDPEFFVFDPKGKPYPATLFAKGTKDNPIPIGPPGLGFFEQRDNLSFEGNVPPAKNKLEFISNIEYLRGYFQKKVEKFGYSLSPNGVEYFENRYLKTPEGMEFGCSKVISAWDSHQGYMNERATPNLRKVKYRVAGFHLHIGYDEELTRLNKVALDILIARLFDLFLTMPSHRIKPEPERIISYGQYGMFRSKSYGVECRTLSTYFTQIQYLSWVWDQLFKIEEFINVCSIDDLTKMIKHAHFVGQEERRLKRIFAEIFHSFDNKESLTKFKESNDIYTDEDLKPTKQPKAMWKPSYTSVGYYSTDIDSDTGGLTW